jgi:membrane protein implicated in regulation of membrane protease activity
MAEDTRTSFGTKVLLVLGAIFAIWLAANLFGSAIRWTISLIGYIVVAVVAYWLGKLSGKNADDD